MSKALRTLRGAFKPETDLILIYRVMSAPTVLVVHPALAITSVRELVDFSRKNPRLATNWAGGDQADRPYFALAMFQSRFGAHFVSVGYKGPADAIRDIANGDLKFAVVPIAVAKAFIDSGRLRPIAVMENNRTSLAATLPSFAEAGFAADYGESWAELFAPRGTSPVVIDKIGVDLGMVLAEPALRDRMRELYMQPLLSSPKEAAERVLADHKKWSEIIRRLNIRVQ